MGVYIALGGNLPFQGKSPQDVIRTALAALPRYGVQILDASRLYRSPAWPDPTAPAYVNAAARVETELHPRGLLEALQAVEADFGRQRSVANASRTLDLDIIDFDRLIVDETGLILPHPRLQDRAFVLLPLRDIAPDWTDPRDGRGLADLLAGIDADDVGAVKVLEEG